MRETFMLTTVDNPYDPRTDFDKWFVYDTSHGYNTCGLLERVACVSSVMPDNFNVYYINQAIDEIISMQPDFYKKLKVKS